MKPTSTSRPAIVAILFAAVFAANTLLRGQTPQAGSLATPLGAADLDPAAFSQLVDGQLSPMPQKDGPRHVVWTSGTAPEWDGAAFGDSKTPGPRYLRIGLNRPVAVGAVLVRGGGTLSLLRPDAKYPGDMADDSQWIAGRRLRDRQPSGAAAADEDYALWVFPEVTTTRALRFTHTAKPTDVKYAGWLGGAYVLSPRLANVAPQAAVMTSANQEAAAKLIDESNNRMWPTWDNGPTGGPHVVSPQHPVDVVLAWPAPVHISGLVALWAGFSEADVQVFRGPPARPVREADEADWQTVTHWRGLQNQYPRGLGANWLDLGQGHTTRGIRLRITAATSESHPHLQQKTAAGKRVWLGELMALSPLGDAPLESAVLAGRAPVPQAEHPPIPVRVHLDKPGRVTLVIENEEGVRVRNLISETPLPAGENIVWWDGTTDTARDLDAPRHGVYRIPAELAAAGTYRVRGLVHDGIHLRYEFPVYNAGDPPWPTADHTGGWLTNHTPPSSALFVPGCQATGGQDLVYLGSYVSEGGDGLAWVDLDGHKRGGVGWVGGAWTGAPFLARDAGPHAAANVRVYVGSAWEGELRLTAVTDKGDKPVVKYALPSGREVTDAALTGLAIHNGLLVCSLHRQKQLLLIDAAAGKVLGTHTIEDPRGLAFDPQGRLLVLAGGQLLRYADPPRLDQREVLVAAGLEDPQHITLDAAGNFYVSDRGHSHQVKVFDPQGKLLRTIGKPGVPKTGPYDPEHMNDPNGLTIDSRGHLWVAETNFQPKRVSVWTLDGRLVRAFYGPSEYGGGGTLDPRDRSRFYYHGMEFRLDWKTGTDRLERVFFRSDAHEYDVPQSHYADTQPETPIYIGSLNTRTGDYKYQRYFTNCYTSNPTNGASIATTWIDRGDAAVPVAAIGRADDWDLLKEARFSDRWPKGVEVRGGRFSEPLMFAWSDASGDGRVQPGEVKFIKATVGGITVMPDLSVVASWVDGRAMHYRWDHVFAASGAPFYDLTHGEVLVDGAQRPTTSGGDQALVDPSGWTVLTVASKPFAPQSLGGVFRGKPRWSYPSLWPGLHASHEAPTADRPGEVIGTTRLLGGFVNPGGDAGPLWAVNGNMGNIYLFTADGLFVAELFRDVRQGVSWAMPIARRGMLLDDVSLHDENFWPSITQTREGQVYLVDGARTSLVRIEGLEFICRLPDATIRVTPDDLKSAADYLVRSESQRQKSQGRLTLRVPIRKTPPVIDGRLDDWADADWATIDRSGVAANFDSHSRPYDITASVAVAGDRLYAAFRTGDANLLQNSGETPQAPFKTGGALDLMIGAATRADADGTAAVEGDLRLLVTKVKGKTLALVYRPVVPGTKQPVQFSSPSRTITIDRVDDVSDQVQLAGAGGDFELSVPLAVLGLRAPCTHGRRPGMVLRGDLGILRGNGFQTLHRAYWSNKATAIVSDVPSEAQLTPQLWGRWTIVDE